LANLYTLPDDFSYFENSKNILDSYIPIQELEKAWQENINDPVLLNQGMNANCA
jgi:hypothetical protein